MIYICCSKTNEKCIESIKMSRHFDTNVSIIDTDHINKTIFENRTKTKNYLLFLSDDEYLNTIQFDDVVDLITNSNENTIANIVVCPEIFTSLKNNYIIINADMNFNKKILFNNSHSILYKLSFLYENFYVGNIQDLSEKFFNPASLFQNIKNEDIFLYNDLDFIVVSSYDVSNIKLINHYNIDSAYKESYEELIKIIKNGYFGMEQQKL